MDSSIKLPPRITLSDKPEPVTDAVDAPDGTITIQGPELIGFGCQVQHPDSAGHPLCHEQGMIGFGVISTADGDLIAVQMHHADGTNLTAFLDVGDVNTFSGCFNETVLTVLRRRELANAQPQGEA